MKKQKETKSGIVLYSDKNVHEKMKRFSYITSPRKYCYSRVKSSVISSGRLSNFGIIYKSKTSENTHNDIHMNSIVDKRKIKKAKSLNNYSLHNLNKVKSINYEKINMKSDIKKQFSYNITKNEIIDKISHNKI